MVGTPVFLALFLMRFDWHYFVSGWVFGAVAITDLLDGYIARKKGLVTNFGAFLDPIADKILTTAAFIGFLVIDRLNTLALVWALLLILVREFAVTSVRLMGAGKGVIISANIWGKLKTIMQYVSILVTIAALEFDTWKTGILQSQRLPDAVYDIPIIAAQVLIWIAVGLTIISGLIYIRDNRCLLSDK